MLKNVLRIALAGALAFALAPFPALADEADSPTGAPDADAPVSDAPYVEGEALVVYHDARAAAADGGIAPFSNGPASSLAEEGFDVEQVWDLSGPDAPEADGGQPAANGAAAPRALSADESAAPAGSDVRVALVSKDGASTEALVDELAALDGVEAAAPNYIRPLAGGANAPDDTFYNLQYGMQDGPGGIHLETALAKDAAAGQAARENVVAVIDSGVDYTHPDLADHMWVNDPSATGLPGTHGYDFADMDDDPLPGTSTAASHGTHCAGIIAAVTGNGEGVAGVAQHTKIMALKCSPSASASAALVDSAMVGSYGYLVQAALAGVNVVAANGSWSPCLYSPVIDYIINQAGKAGVVSLIAAGNDGADVEAVSTKLIGAESPYAVIVASSNEANELAQSSNYSATQVDLAAPGALVLSTVSTQAAGAFFSALLSKQAGKSPLCYSTVGEELGKEGFKVRIESPDPSEAVDPEQVLSLERMADGSLSVTLDATKLAHPESLADYFIVIGWDVDNPFLANPGLRAEDYAASITPVISAESAQKGLSVVAEAKLMTQPGSPVFESYLAAPSAESLLDNYGIYYTEVNAVNTTDPKLRAGAYLYFESQTGEEIERASCTVSGYGIGVKSVDYVPYALMSGTSMAAPAATGAFAELASLYPDESPLELRGRLVGGTEPLEADVQGKVASGGRLSFDVAANDDALNANTWAAACDESTGLITVQGRGLQDASLAVDGEPVSATASPDGSALSFTADAALFDGARHRFDVTDGSTGRVYRAAYTVPSAAAPAAHGLVKVCDLPPAAGAGSLVAAGESLFYADVLGGFLYSCADPSAPDATWTQLAAPGMGYLEHPLDPDGALGRTTMRFAYADGRLYAFGVDARSGAAGMDEALFCASYDIAADAWSKYAEIGRVACPAPGQMLTGVVVMEPVTYGGEVHTGVTVSFGNDAGEVIDRVLLVQGAGDSFEAQEYSIEVFPDSWPIRLFADGDELDMLVVGGEGDENYLARSKREGGAWRELEKYAAAPLLPALEVNALPLAPSAVTGNGVVVAGVAFKGAGDVVLLDSAKMTWEGLGSFGTTASDGAAASSLAMLGDTLYFAAMETGAGEAGEASAASAAASAGATAQGALYRLNDDAAARLAGMNRTARAAAGEGGAATVSDWRGAPATELSLRAGDTATWTATPAEGYAFAGWYDASGAQVSAEATYRAPVHGDVALAARFVAVAPTPGPVPLAPTGDGAASAFALLACAMCASAGIAWATRGKSRRKIS